MASEVGNGQVSIFPVFKGFRRAVSAEVEGSAKDGARGFQTVFDRSSKSTGTSAGRGFKSAFESSSKGLGEKQLRDLQSEVAKSSRAVSASRLKEQDAAGKVRVAEQQLLETRKKYGAESSRTVAAEEKLATTQRALKAAQDVTKTSTDGLRDAQGKLAQSAQQATRSAASAGGGFRAAFSGLTPVVQGVGRGISTAFASSMEAAKQVVGRGMKAISTVAKITGAAIAAVLAGAIAAGFSRMTSIENAEAKLRGLGNSAENVTAIMSDALAAVRGTAFGLDEAATIAASAVAAGIKPGQQLEKYLKLTADAATIAGVSLSEMGSIINKVSTKGVAQMENINQVSERGIPIMQYLADEYGVTQQELSKMVSAGKVDAETFRRVLEENLGGAALESGNTTVGAFKNMRAAISRFGVGLLDPVFPLFKDFFNLVGGGFDALTAKIGPFSDVLGPRLQQGFQNALSSVDSFTAGARAKVAALVDGFRGEWNVALAVDEQGPLFRLGENLRSGMDAAKGAIDSVRLAFDGMFGDVGRYAGIDLGAIFGDVDFSGFANVATQLSPLLNIFDGLKPVIPVLVEGLAQIAATLAGALSEAAPVVADLFAQIGEAIGTNLAALLPSIVGLFESLAGVLGELVPALAPVVEQLGGVFSDALTALTPVLGQLVDFIAQLLPQLIPLIDPLVQIASAAIQLVTPFLDLVTAVLPPLIELITTMPGGLMTMQMSLIALTFVLQAVAAALTFVADFVSGLMDSIEVFAGYINGEFTPQEFIDKMISIGGPFGALAKWAADTGKAIGKFVTDSVANVASLASSVGTKIAEIGKFFTDLPGKITGAFSNAGSMLFDAGKNIVQGLINGVKSLAQNAINAVVNIGGDMVDGVKSFLGIKSPSRVFRYEVGQQMGAGLVMGIEDSRSSITAAVNSMVALPASSPLTVASAAALSASEDGGVTVELVGDEAVLAQIVDVRIRRSNESRGLRAKNGIS